MECQPSGWHGDNYCDDGVLNTENCKWDGGDCCGDSVNTNYCSVSFDAKFSFIFPFLILILQIVNKTGEIAAHPMFLEH